jgi:hypothetical protein
MINFELLNHALGNVNSDEFAALYFIANTISLKKRNRIKLYREMMADNLGWLDETRPQYGLKKVTRITNSLVEKGYLKKDIVYENPQKSVTYFSLNTQILDEKLETSVQKSVPHNNNKKEIIKEIKYNNDLDENPTDGFPPSLNEEEVIFEDCCKKGLSTYDCYSTFAGRGQSSFIWLCNKIRNDDYRFYAGTTEIRQKVAKEYNLTIPTYS